MVYFKEENSNTGKKSFQLQEIFYTPDFGVLKAVPLFLSDHIYLSIYLSTNQPKLIKDFLLLLKLPFL